MDITIEEIRKYCKNKKGDMKPSTTTYFEELENCYVIVKNVPCFECSQCGEVVYTADVTSRLDEIIGSITDLMTDTNFRSMYRHFLLSIEN